MQTPLTLTFGSEEVIFLLRALQIDTIVGFTNALFAALDAPQQALALAVADRNLRAGHYIERTGRLERQVAPTLVGLFSRYAHPDSLFKLQQRNGSTRVDYHYACSGIFVIEHQEIDTDIHQFTVMEGRAGARDRIGALLEWKNITGRGEPVTLPRAAMQAARARTGMPEIRDILSGYMPVDMAADLATTFAYPDVIYEFVAPPLDTLRLTLAQGAKGCYLLKSDPDTDMIQVVPGRSEDVVHEIDVVLAALLGQS